MVSELPAAGYGARRGEYGRRFVFISHIREEKGVDVLLEAAEALPPGYTVDLYGSIQDERYAASGYFEGKRARYRGALKTEEVLPTLARYDVLVLPTHWKTEGYPGIIIEAMSLGIPTISTPIGGIPELIADGQDGLIIKPHDARRCARPCSLSTQSATNGWLPPPSCGLTRPIILMWLMRRCGAT